MISRRKEYLRKLKKEIRYCWEKGLTIPETAKILRVSKSTVIYHAELQGLSFRKSEYPPRKFTREELLSLHSLGFTKKEIARILGVNKKTIYTHAKRMGITFLDRIPKRKFTNEQLIDLQKRGFTRQQAAKELAVSISTIDYYRKLLNMRFPSESEYTRERVIKLHRDGCTLKKVAYMLGVHENTVLRHARRAGISFRRYSNSFGLQRKKDETPKEYSKRYKREWSRRKKLLEKSEEN